MSLHLRPPALSLSLPSPLLQSHYFSPLQLSLAHPVALRTATQKGRIPTPSTSHAPLLSLSPPQSSLPITPSLLLSPPLSSPSALTQGRSRLDDLHLNTTSH